MHELPTFIKIIGWVAVVGGVLLSALIFWCKFWFVQMGARALVKYVHSDRRTTHVEQYRTYGTHISEWNGKVPDPTPPSSTPPPRGTRRGRFTVIRGGR
jgi:hypothetical protein